MHRADTQDKRPALPFQAEVANRRTVGDGDDRKDEHYPVISEDAQRSLSRMAFMLFLTSLLASVFGWLYAGLAGRFFAFSAWAAFVVLPYMTGIQPLGSIHRRFFVREQRARTIGAIAFVVLAGSMWVGAKEVFYAALVTVPIFLPALLLTPLRHSTDDEGSSVLTTDSISYSEDGTNQAREYQ